MTFLKIVKSTIVSNTSNELLHFFKQFTQHLNILFSLQLKNVKCFSHEK